MLVYKTFFKVAKSYAKSSIIFTVVFIVILLVMTQLGDQDVSQNFQADSVDYVVIDRDNTDASQALIDYLNTKHHQVTLKDTDPETLEDNLYYEQISYVMYIEEGFEDKLADGQTKDLLSYTMKTDGAKGYFFKQDVNAYLDTVRIYLTADYTLKDALKAAYDTAKEANDSTVKKVTFGDLASSNAEETSMGYFFKYFAYVILSALTLSLSSILIAFHRKDLKERLAVSALSERKQKMGIGMGAVTLCLFTWLVYMLIAFLSFGGDTLFSTNGLRNLLNSFVFIVCVFSISLVLGSFNMDENVLNFITNILSLGSSFLCGVFVPMWYFSGPVKMIGRFFPTYWYINNCDMLSGASGQAFTSQTYWTNIGVQCIFILAIFSIYLLVSSSKSRKEL